MANTRRIFAGLMAALITGTAAADYLPASGEYTAVKSVQLGPRPFYLVDEMEDGKLKRELASCAARTQVYQPSVFSIGHRGAALQFPEHTRESYVAAARMGAGILECDVAFTADEELVCRHALCDLHTTTNILATPLAAKCSVPPQFDPVTGDLVNGPAVRCCTSDLTVAEFKTLAGKMDAANPNATSIEEYMGGTANFRTDLYATEGTLLTHAESIELFESLGVDMTPELKTPPPEVPMPFNGTFSQQDYAQKLIDEYRAAGVSPRRVWPQSFLLDDVLYWIDFNADFGRQAVFLDETNIVTGQPLSYFMDLKMRGVNIIAPPMPTLLTTLGDRIVPSEWARRAKMAGLEIISWTTERSGRVNEDVPGGPFYYQTTLGALRNDGDILRTIDVLAQDVGIIGLFSDWPATTSFYANCKDIPGLRQGNGHRYDDRGRGSRNDDFWRWLSGRN